MAPSPKLVARLTQCGNHYHYIDLPTILSSHGLHRLPYSIRLLLENVARCSPETLPDLLASIRKQGRDRARGREVPFFPNRMMFHDTTCLPALADFAGIRDRVAELGGDPTVMQPVIPTVLTIDHSVIVESYGRKDAARHNLSVDFRRNRERYRFVKWAQQSLNGFEVVPPGTGIIHQLNMESLSPVVCKSRAVEGKPLLHMDNMVATDSHTPMINALGVLAWGIGGLEALAVMLGEPVLIPFPEVVGVKLVNRLAPHVNAVDLALKLTRILRAKGVVGKFIEFYGPGLKNIDLATRGTLANMAPEYGATVAFFPFDDATMDYLVLTGRQREHRNRIQTYLEAQELWHCDGGAEPDFDGMIELDLGTIEPGAAGPSQPHQWRRLADVGDSFRQAVLSGPRVPPNLSDPADQSGKTGQYRHPSCKCLLTHGAVSIAAITSCTNTANPHLMIQAGLLARNAKARGLHPKPWVKTSLAPGSRVVADYLSQAGLLADFSALGFDLAGFGCMTCIGNSGRLEAGLETIVEQGLQSVAVLSGNRNFEGRINPKVVSAYLVSPAMVVAYAIAGTVQLNIQKDPLTTDQRGRPTYLFELMPSAAEVQQVLERVLQPEHFRKRTATIWLGTSQWRKIDANGNIRFSWDPGSTYLRRPVYTRDISRQGTRLPPSLTARPFMILGDNVTTDHISPASAIPRDSSAGRWLLKHGENYEDLNQYSTRRSNHEVMIRGAFTNGAIKNRLLEKQQGPGGWAYALNGAVKPVFEAALSYRENGIPFVIFAGINYGAGSSRDWAAKAQAILGVRIVVAESFERIHRSNLIGMGVIPLELSVGMTVADLSLKGNERLTFAGLDNLKVGENPVMLHRRDGQYEYHPVSLVLRIDALQEIRYLDHGGILPYITRRAVA